METEVQPFKKPKYDMRNVMLLVMALVMVLMVIIFAFATKDGQRCVSNPLVYGVQKGQVDISDKNDWTTATGKIWGVLTFENPSLRPVYFDNETMSTYSPAERDSQNNPINFSDIKFA